MTLSSGASHTIINPSRKGVGQTYVVFGSQSAFPAQLSLSDLDGSNGFRINGIGTVDYYGVYSRSAGDFNDDGINDFIAGASGEGASYVIYGRDFGIGRASAPALLSLNPQPPALPEAARIVGVDAQALAFNELADPTGPAPIPVGVPNDLDDPATPGFIAPNVLEPVAVLRPGQTPTVELPSVPELIVPVVEVPVPETEQTTDPGTVTDPGPSDQATPLMDPPANDPLIISDATSAPVLPTTVTPVTAVSDSTIDSTTESVRVGGASGGPLLFALMLLVGVRFREKM